MHTVSLPKYSSEVKYMNTSPGDVIRSEDKNYLVLPARGTTVNIESLNVRQFEQFESVFIIGRLKALEVSNA